MTPTADAKSQLRKTMGFWDVLLFNIATVLGPRWIAAAGHNGPSSISLWAIAAVFFFVPGALVINELSSRFPEEGGLYVWTKEAFGDFHGFIAGWTYWIYTVFYFPGLLLASASMSAYIFGGRGAALAQDRAFLLMVFAGAAGGCRDAQHHRAEYRQVAAERGRRGHLRAAADLMLAALPRSSTSGTAPATHFTVANMLPAWNWDTVNFWSQIAFAFTGPGTRFRDERGGARSAAHFAARGFGCRRADRVHVHCRNVRQSSRWCPQAISIRRAAFSTPSPSDAVALKHRLSRRARGHAGHGGQCRRRGITVAGMARVPFVVGIDRYLPQPSGRSIRDGKRLTSQSWCRPSPGQSCWSARSMTPRAAHINSSSMRRSFSTSFLSSTCLRPSSGWGTAATARATLTPCWYRAGMAGMWISAAWDSWWFLSVFWYRWCRRATPPTRSALS